MKRFLYIVLSVLIFYSCKKELDFEYHQIEPILVIEGSLTQSGCKTRLTYTTPMDEIMDTLPVTDAVVMLKDISEGRSIILDCDEYGNFVSGEPGVNGHAYELEISYQGNVYTSTCVMRPATEIIKLEFSWLKMPYDYVAILEVKFKELESFDNYYWIKIYRNNDAYQWLLCDNRSARDGEITQMTMTSRKDLENEDEKDILKDGDVVRVDISTISREMYDYLSALKISSNGPQMFEGKLCLGCFLASGNASATVTYRPDELKER